MQRAHFPVAVVGMHGRFPDAYDVKDFWGNLSAGNNTIRQVPKQRWDWEELFGDSANESESTTINCAAFMPMVDRFDCRFFGIMPREAEAMDPQQRLFMQTAYAALEDAGYAPGSLAGSNTGVFVGIGNADYPMMMRRHGAVFDIYRATGLALTCIANRVSFSLDIHGPSESIDTACSGSLVAIHRAVQAMQTGECERAIVGGVNLLVGPDLFIAFEKAGMLSKSARCRAFDATANGYVRGEGVAALVLCPLEVAEKNGDYIYGVIQGSAVNHGGRAHSFTAPNAAAQSQVVRAAWENSGKDFHKACMIETHGTGTPLGDPIEVNGLKKVSEGFGFSDKRRTAKTAKSRIALGALKSHVGHMEATAGVGGVIKTLLSMKYRIIPKNLNFSELNPHINLENTPYFIPTDNVELGRKSGSATLLGGVNSFGFGGVNAHVVIESHDVAMPLKIVKKQKPDVALSYLIAISGKDENSLRARVYQLIQFLEVSCNSSGDAVTSAAIMDVLRASLGVTAEVEAAPLASLNISVSQWLKALNALASVLGRAVDFNVVQNCISLQEAAQEIARHTQINNIVTGSDRLSLCVRVALPEAEIRTAGLDSIAYSLMQGRDSLKQRLACVVNSKAKLLSLLRAYLTAPDAPHPQLWTDTIRMDAVASGPPAATAHIATETLSAWAEWWVKTRSAALDWNILYPKSAMPRKFPLPAYPFQLDRIWYKAAATVEMAAAVTAQSKTQPKVQSPAAVVREAIVLPSSITAAWDAGMAHSQLPIPSSVASLAYLLDYAIYKNQGAPVELENVMFGPPRDIQDERLVFAYSPGAGSGLMQCLAARDDRKVISQATLKNYSGNNFVAPESDFATAAHLPVDMFFAQLEKGRISLGKVLHCLNAIHAAEQKLKLELTLPEWQAKNGRFWVPLMAAIFAGSAYLNHQHGKDFQLPWKIRSVVFDPEASQAITTIYLQIDHERGTSSVVATSAASRPVLQLDGIVSRASQPIVNSVEASVA